MRTARGLFARLVDPDHLERAARETTRGKRRRPDVAAWLLRADEELERLREGLLDGSWRPGPFHVLQVREPKPRCIARARIEDRVAHAGVALLLEPLFERSCTDDDFACRAGKGTHRALVRLVESMRRARFAAHLDVKSYFASVDLDVLRGLLARRVRDERFLAVVDRVLEAGRGLFDLPSRRRFARMDPDWPPPGRGLPIGARTSQLFAAHVYLDGLDHFVRREVGVAGYVRYVDDLFLFGRGRAEVRGAVEAVRGWVEGERNLRLKGRPRILSCAGHLDALGHRVTREGIEPLRRRLKDLARAVREGEELDVESLRRGLAARVAVNLFG